MSPVPALPLRELYQLGVVVALGVLLDTFVVRGLLVPGIVILLGRWTWWPGPGVVGSSQATVDEVRRTNDEVRTI